MLKPIIEYNQTRGVFSAPNPVRKIEVTVERIIGYVNKSMNITRQERSNDFFLSSSSSDTPAFISTISFIMVFKHILPVSLEFHYSSIINT